MKGIIGKITGIICITAFGAALLAHPVKADPGVTVSFDKESAEIGEELIASVVLEGETDGATPPDITVNYDPARMSFITADVEYGGGDGGLITLKDKAAKITFSTLSGGDATVEVTAVLDNDITNTYNASATISVNGEDIAGASQTDAIPESSTGIAASTIQSDEGFTVSTVFSDEFMPVLFHKETTKYKDQDVECAKFDNGNIVLLYVLDGTGEAGSFKIYDEAKSELNDFRMIRGVDDKFIIVLPYAGENAIPARFKEADCEWLGQTLRGYVVPEFLTVLDEENKIYTTEFMLVYAVNSEGTSGWYMFDKIEGTYQRFFDYAGASNPEYGASYQGDGSQSESGKSHEGGLWFVIDKLGNAAPYVMIGLVTLVVILIVILIVLGATRSMPEEEDYFEPHYRNGDDMSVFEQRILPANEMPGAGAKKRTDNDKYREDDKQFDNAPVKASKEAPNDEKSVADNAKLDEENEKIRQEMFEKDMEMEPSSNDEENGTDMYMNEGTYQNQPDEQMYMNDEYQDDYFTPRFSKKELKRQEKEAKKAAKEGRKDDKWREKEEKKVAKRQVKGFEETKPIDWGNVEEHMKEMPEDDRRPRGNTTQINLSANAGENEELHTEDLLRKKEEIEAKIREKKEREAVHKQGAELAKQSEELAKSVNDKNKIPMPQSRTSARDQKTLEDEARARAEYEQRQRAHEEQRRAAREQMRIEEEKRKAAEAEKKAAKQAQIAEKEAKARAEYEQRQRNLEEQRRAMEEQKRALEEQRRANEAARARAQYEEQMRQQQIQQQMQQQQLQQRQQEESFDEDFQFEFLKF